MMPSSLRSLLVCAIVLATIARSRSTHGDSNLDLERHSPTTVSASKNKRPILSSAPSAKEVTKVLHRDHSIPEPLLFHPEHNANRHQHGPLSNSKTNQFIADKVETRLTELPREQFRGQIVKEIASNALDDVQHEQQDTTERSLLDIYYDTLSKDGRASLFNRYKYSMEMMRQNTSHIVEELTSSVSGGTSKALIKELCHVAGEITVCYKHGDSECRCQGGLADCSGRPYRPNINYAPRLPNHVKCLLFRDNHVQFFDDSFFHNVSTFEVIDFSYNDLLVVSKNTFQIFLGHLKYLILNFNMGLKYKYIERVLQYAPSLRFDLINLGLKGNEMPNNFFQPFSHIATQEFHFDLNFFPQLDLTQFAVLKNINFLSFSNCSINQVISASLPKLTGLDLNNNFIPSFPDTCTNEVNSIGTNMDESIFPKLKMLYLNSNNISHFPNATGLCLPSLVNVGLTQNSIASLESFSLANLPSLKVIYLDEMKGGITSIGPNALSSQSMIELHMSNNKIDFSSPLIDGRLLHNCSRLKVLYLSHNDMSMLTPAKSLDLLSIPSLEYLYLGSCRLKSVPHEAFSQLKHLQKLFLYTNEITSLPMGAFEELTSLQYLFLRENLIQDVRQGVFSQALIDRLSEVDLSANDFQCTCDILWFKNWLADVGSTLFVGYPDRYTCANIPEKKVADFSISEQACYYSKSTYITFVVCLSIMLAGFLVFVVLFRYRWHLRLALYEWKVRSAYQNIEEEGDYQYDVFIVYCNDDSDWVLDQLLDTVEQRWGHRAFIHERDFQAGGFIVDNMARAMNLSRRIVVVLTSSFARSRWCNFELQLCQSHVIQHDLPSLLVLQLEPIRMRDMTEMLIAVRNSTTFLEWPYSPQDEPLFWNRLQRCMEAMRGVARPLAVRAVDNDDDDDDYET